MARERYTVKDVRRAVEHVESVARRLGVLDEGTALVLEEGSTTYGRAWRLYTTPAGETYYRDGLGLGSGMLGTTAREACRTLYGLAAGLHLAEGRREPPADVGEAIRRAQWATHEALDMCEAHAGAAGVQPVAERVAEAHRALFRAANVWQARRGS